MLHITLFSETIFFKFTWKDKKNRSESKLSSSSLPKYSRESAWAWTGWRARESMWVFHGQQDQPLHSGANAVRKVGINIRSKTGPGCSDVAWERPMWLLNHQMEHLSLFVDFKVEMVLISKQYIVLKFHVIFSVKFLCVPHNFGMNLDSPNVR